MNNTTDTIDTQAGDAALLLPPNDAAPERVADQLYRKLRRAIIEGQLPARSRLIEVELAQALNASRTPVREAISRLTSDQLVRPLKHGGVEVVDTSSELDEIYMIREALEGCAARLAAERITDEELKVLDGLIDETHASMHDIDARVQINQRFHEAITRAARSERLARMVESFQEFFLNEKMLASYSPRESQTAIAQHSEIVAALRAHDSARAEKLVRKHLEQDRKRALKEKAKAALR
ncbi:GntR family transcriptional regulator [Caballeronia sp. LZ043]|uniref:GntR family transcriptional regulator n=1 Tax=Caballeronia sp. LZ043 TaxID=3038569 RepID=UPI0028623313|nr:GntR family transcriptional regulator [Caballeronia sp. LZ043]MDR5822042.1 GntR family transcriptional regulator [Caballeronia sp. LZ043]